MINIYSRIFKNSAVSIQACPVKTPVQCKRKVNYINTRPLSLNPGFVSTPPPKLSFLVKVSKAFLQLPLAEIREVCGNFLHSGRRDWDHLPLLYRQQAVESVSAGFSLSAAWCCVSGRSCAPSSGRSRCCRSSIHRSAWRTPTWPRHWKPRGRPSGSVSERTRS